MPKIPAHAAFLHREFRLLQTARFCGVIAYEIQSVAIGWQVYELTGRAFDLGLLGLAQFLPAMALSAVTGQVADQFDRRRIMMLCHALLALASVALSLIASARSPNIALVYAVLVLVGTARAFSGPASQALMPNLVPREHFSNAIAWSSGLFHIAVVLGPALGGFAYASLGPTRVFAACAAIEFGTLAALNGIAPRPVQREARARSLSELARGLGFVWRNKLVLGAVSLDLFAVLLGGAVALLPIFARDILKTGPYGLGLLRSAPAFGATLVAIVLAYRPLRQRVGITLLGCVALFGAATVIFGLSRSFPVSLAALIVAGGADMVSVYVRHTLVQLNTPDAMRGRVAAVNLVFIGASNELGQFESGLAAAWLGVVPSVVLGGIGTCFVVLVWSVLFPELRRTDRLESPDFEHGIAMTGPTERNTRGSNNPG